MRKSITAKDLINTGDWDSAESVVFLKTQIYQVMFIKNTFMLLVQNWIEREHSINNKSFTCQIESDNTEN